MTSSRFAKFYLDHHDNDDGSKTYDVCDGGQTIARVCETMFDDPSKARIWAARVRDALNRDKEAGNIGSVQ